MRFVLQTDHKNLTYLNFEGSAKVKRWKLSIQEYSFDIQYIEGPKNVVADGLSRLCFKYLEGEAPDGRDVQMLACFFSGLCVKVRNEEEPLQEEEVRASESNALYFDSARMSADEIICAHFELGLENELYSLQDALGAAIEEPIYSEIKAVHNALVGHSGVDRTLDRLRVKGVTFKYQRELVKKFIRECAW